MKKIILLVLCLLLAFYVGWPLWSAYRIHAALESNDIPTLDAKVDFPSVRASLRPVVSAEVERALDKAADRGGIFKQIIGGAVKDKLGPQLVETMLNGFVNSKQVAEIYRRRGDIRDIVNERIAKRGGAPGESPPIGKAGEGRVEDQGPGGASGETAVAKPPAREKLGFGNIKRLAFTGPLSFEVGIAKDRAAPVPDITAQLGFKGFDWKLVGLRAKARAGS